VVKTLKSNNGTEYTNKTFEEYFPAHMIYYQNMCPYTLTQNDVVERNNKSMLEVARYMMIFMNVPKYL
jgi:hypothetical protein